MSMFQLCHGLQSIVHKHPPLVMFFLCLVTLIVSFLSLGIYIQTHPVRDVDVEQDWDSFMHSLSLLTLCSRNNKTEQYLPSPFNGSQLSPENVSSLSLVADLKVNPWNAFTNISDLRMFVKSKDLGIKGYDDSLLIVTLSLFNGTKVCNGSDKDCVTKYCVTFTAPEFLMPRARFPSRCSTGNLIDLDLYVAEKGAKLSAHCYEFVYRWDPAMHTMIPEDDRTLSSNCLLYAALSLLFFGALLCLFSALFTKSPKDKWHQGPL